MNETFEQYKVEPHPWWKTAQYGGLDAYETMTHANRRGWHEIAVWGSKGWDLGSWPLVIIYFRYHRDCFQVIEYVEGDVTEYSCPTAAIREAITNELAYFHWKMQEQDCVRGSETFEDLDDTFKGPYRRS